MKILLLEDDLAVAQFVCAALEAAGFAVDSSHDLPVAADFLDREDYDCLIFDRHLPSGDALDLLHTMASRHQQTPPTLLLTALDTMEDKIAGLALADDYLVKPFAMDELLARVKALLRRKVGTQAELTGAGITLDRLQRSVSRQGRDLELNPMEFKLLEYLLLHKNQNVSRQMLLQHVWEYNFEPTTTIVETYISRLRTKLEVNGMPPAIVTIRGVGYTVADI